MFCTIFSKDQLILYHLNQFLHVLLSVRGGDLIEYTGFVENFEEKVYPVPAEFWIALITVRNKLSIDFTEF